MINWRIARRRAGPIWLLGLSLALVLLAVAASSGAAGVVLLGDQKVESGNDSDSAGTAEAFRTTATASGPLGTLSVYVGSTSSASKLVAGLYSSNAANTHPAALLAQGSLNAPVKGAWNTVTLASQPQIAAGSSYWITVLAPTGSGTVGFRDVLGGGLSETSGQTSLTTLPSSWTSGTTYHDGPLSAYGSSSVAPDTTPPTTPTGLVQTGSTATSVSLAWNASSDDVRVTGYGIYANGQLRTSTAGTTATVNLACATSSTIAVDAFDAAGNRSPQTSATMRTDVCPPDTTPPSVPTGLKVSGTTPTTITFSWNASSDDVGVAGYGLFLDGVSQTPTTNTSATFTGLLCGSSHTLAVDAFDGSVNTSATATLAAAAAACPDTTPPSVSLTSPADGTTVSGTVQLAASAADDVGVAGVQFQVDGAALGAADTTAPYSISWDTTGAANGRHTITAVARDAGGNSTTSAAVGVTVTNAIARPTPVPAASVNGVTVGPGFVVGTDHQVIRTPGGSVYVITADDDPCQVGGSGVIRAWKGTGAQPANSAVPTGFVEMDASHHPVSGGSNVCQYTGGANSVLFGPDSRLDGAGTIHMVYIDMFSRNLYYQTFSTLTDTWGPRALVAAFASTDSGFSWPRGGQAALTLDANDVPHVAYSTDGTSNQIDYTDKVSGSWSAPVSIASGTNEMHPSMTTALDGSIHLVWLDNADAAHPVVKYARYSGGRWGPVETVSVGDPSTLSDSNGDQKPSVGVDGSGRPFVAYLDGTVNGADDYVRVRYRNASGVWTDDSPPGTAGGASSPTGTLFAHAPQVYVSRSNDVFVFLGHDVLISPGGFEYQAGGPGGTWSAYASVDPRNENNTTAGYPGLDGSVSARYDPLRDTNSNLVDIVYYDEHDGTPGYFHHATVYYKAIQLR
jgi:hypothetical protein